MPELIPAPPLVNMASRHTLPPIHPKLQDAFNTLMHFLKGIRYIRDTALAGWHTLPSKIGQGSIIVFLADYLACQGWSLQEVSAALPVLIRARTQPVAIPGAPNGVCGASLVWDLAEIIAGSLQRTPHGAFAAALVERMADAGCYERTLLIDVTYRFLLDGPEWFNNPAASKHPWNRIYRPLDGIENAARALNSQEAASQERLVRESFQALPIESLIAELEWEFSQGTQALHRDETDDQRRRAAGEEPAKYHPRPLPTVAGPVPEHSEDNQLGEANGAVPIGSQPKRPEGPETPMPAVIQALGNRQYRIGNRAPLVVSELEDCVLQAFLGTPSMESGDLASKSGVERPDKVLKKLQRKYNGAFAPAIRLPGAKGAGGYHVSICKESSSQSPLPD